MSRSLNKVTLIGNLGADPEVRSTSNGSRVATLSLATSRRWKNQSGEQQEKTEWHRVILWNNKGSSLADLAERYCKKGDKVYVEGSIEYRSWQDREGQTRYTTEITAREVILLSGKSDGLGVVHAGQQGGRAASAAAPEGQGSVVRGFPRGARRARTTTFRSEAGQPARRAAPAQCPGPPSGPVPARWDRRLRGQLPVVQARGLATRSGFARLSLAGSPVGVGLAYSGNCVHRQAR